MNAEQYWERAIKILREEINDVIFKAFITPIIPVRYTDEYFIVKLSIEASMYRDMLKKYIKKINSALTKVFERPMTLIYEDEIDQDDNVTLQKERIEAARKDKGLNPEYSFENYVVGSSNNTAYAAAVAIADNPGEDDMYNPFFIYGGVGLGKTHLMHAIGNYFMDNNPNAKVLYVTCEKFTNEFISAISSRTTMEFKDKYRELDLLLIDDVQFLSGKTETQEEFFHTFNSLIDAKKQIVMCSDRKPSEIKTLTDRLVGRMSSGIMFDIKAPDFETRTAILEKKAEKKNIKIDTKILQYIALKITSNIRILEGAFNNIALIARGYPSDVSRKNDGLIRFFDEFLSENESAHEMYRNMKLPTITEDMIDKCVAEITIEVNRDFIRAFILNGQTRVREIIDTDKIMSEDEDMSTGL